MAEKSSIHGRQGKAWFLDKNPGLTKKHWWLCLVCFNVHISLALWFHGRSPGWSPLMGVDPRWSALTRADPRWSALIRVHPWRQEFRVFSLSISADRRGSVRISHFLVWGWFKRTEGEGLYHKNHGDLRVVYSQQPLRRANLKQLSLGVLTLQFSMFSSIFPWFSSISRWFSLISRFLPSFPCIWFYWLFDGSYCFSLSAVDFPWWSFLIFRCFCSQNGAARRSTVFLKVVCLHF